LLKLLDDMLNFDIRQVAATLLHPRYRSLKKIPDFNKDQSYIYVRQQIRQLRDKEKVETQNQQPLTEPQKNSRKRQIFLHSSNQTM